MSRYWATSGWQGLEPEVDRVRRDILLLAAGDPEKVVEYVELALLDYRDVLYLCEYVDSDPAVMWRRLCGEFREAGILSPEDVRDLKVRHMNRRGEDGSGHDRAIEALQRLCTLLAERQTQLTREQFEQIRAYGKHRRARACWSPLRRQISK